MTSALLRPSSVRAIGEPLPFKDHRTLAEVWGLTMGSPQPNSPAHEPAPERPKIPYVGYDPKERQFQ